MLLPVWLALGSVLGAIVPAAGGAPVPNIEYQNYRRENVPWSIHVVKVPRATSEFRLHAMHATGRAVGLSTLTDQVMSLRLSNAEAVPIAAINGDFYQRGGPYAGDPRGLQVLGGELISAPSGSASFWIDAIGDPHATNTVSKFRVTWPDGTSAPIGLNGAPRSRGVELYTPALGPSTQTAGGRDYVLEQQGTSRWLPLRPDRTYAAQIREINETGNTPLKRGTLVLAVGPALARTLPRFQVGDEVTISTAVTPNLGGATAAISGGPILVRGGKRQRIVTGGSEAYESSSMLERHPRSAVGWNDNFYFLVEVDGRHRGLSVGMTLNELAAFMLELGCQEAMNLDGGGSATLWYNGKIQNRPCDGYERPIANSLVVLKTARAAPRAGGAAVPKTGGASQEAP